MGVARDVERISPSDRIKVGWLEACDYLVYPVEAALTDQLCGIVETHGGKGILHKVMISWTSPSTPLRPRRTVRDFGPDYAAMPLYSTSPWATTSDCRRPMETVSGLAGRFLDPALMGEAGGRRWNPEARVGGVGTVCPGGRRDGAFAVG